MHQERVIYKWLLCSESMTEGAGERPSMELVHTIVHD